MLGGSIVAMSNFLAVTALRDVGVAQVWLGLCLSSTGQSLEGGGSEVRVRLLRNIIY